MQFPICDRSQFCGKVQESILPNAPESIGKGVNLGMLVYSDYAGDKHTHRSHTSFIIYLNTILTIGIQRDSLQLRHALLVKILYLQKLA